MLFAIYDIIMDIFLHLFYQFGHIILFSVELGNMSMFIAFHILLNSIIILLTSVFQILEFHHTTESNNKWKPQYYCFLYMIYNILM
jgi:hypothetical protein